MTRAAVITEVGGHASLGAVTDVAPGSGQVEVHLEAAALNPVDLAVSRGTFYGGQPELPYVPGIEAVGVVRGGSLDAMRVYAWGGGHGITKDGLARDRFVIDESVLIPLPDGADPAMACALGTAGLAGWLPLAWRAPVRAGETVLVLGATGTAGRVALQAARHLGAGRVVGVGRHASRLESISRFADAVVSLDDEDFVDTLAEACGHGGPTLIYDTLWAEPAVIALTVAATGARLVQVGTSAGANADVPSALVRGKQTELVGYSNFAVPSETLVAGYLTMVDLAMAGKLSIDVERIPLDDVAGAWAGLERGDAKYALVP